MSRLACDVTSPLLGPRGASAVFGPQKGAAPEQVAMLDTALGALADALEAAAGRRVRDLPGAGAAGGLGAAFLALGATRRPGVEVVVDAAGLARHVDGADLVLTGEGAVDAQTLRGKTPAGVAAVAGRAGVPVIAFAGRVDPSADTLLDHGFAAVVPILRTLGGTAEVLRAGPENLEHAVATALRLLRLGAAGVTAGAAGVAAGASRAPGERPDGDRAPGLATGGRPGERSRAAGPGQARRRGQAVHDAGPVGATIGGRRRRPAPRLPRRD